MYRILCQRRHILIQFESHADDDQTPAINHESPVGAGWANWDFFRGSFSIAPKKIDGLQYKLQKGPRICDSKRVLLPSGKLI